MHELKDDEEKSTDEALKRAPEQTEYIQRKGGERMTEQRWSIWKFKLEIGETAVRIPTGSDVLSVQVQHGELQLWAMVRLDLGVSCERRFVVVGTGHYMPSGRHEYLGTFQLADGNFVGHVFEVHRG